MYLNLYQKYILELLEEYGGLLKRQLEFMVKRFKEPHLRDINGYVHQLDRFEKIQLTELAGEEAVILPGRRIDADIVRSVDIMLKFSGCLVHHNRGRPPVSLQFEINSDASASIEVNILPVDSGFEKEAVYLAEHYVTEFNDSNLGQSPEWIFLLRDRAQMQYIRPNAEYSFAVMEENEPVFYRDTKTK